MKKFSVLLALLLLATGAVSAKPKHPAPRLFHYQGEVSLRGAVSAPTPGLGSRTSTASASTPTSS